MQRHLAVVTGTKLQKFRISAPINIKNLQQASNLNRTFLVIIMTLQIMYKKRLRVSTLESVCVGGGGIQLNSGAF